MGIVKIKIYRRCRRKDIEMEQLKPCPFCGSTNVVAMHNSERDEQIVPGTDVKLNTWMVECQECLSGTGYEKTEQAAIERWNGRVY